MRPGDSRNWLTLAVGALMLSGLLSLVLVVGRAPGLSALLTDPLFARRCLVVHVNLALVVWLVAVLAALYAQLPTREGSAPRGHAVHWAVGGVAVMVASAAMPGAAPVLSNFVPAVDHPVFAVGYLVFAAAVAGFFLGGRRIPQPDEALDPAASYGLLAAAGAYLLALVTLAASWLVTPFGLPAQSYYEMLFWGAGHVLQVAHVAGMLSVWLLLLQRATGAPAVGRRVARVLFDLLLLPVAAAPWLALCGSRTGFTRLMQFGIFPPVLIFACLCLLAVARARAWRSPHFLAFAASIALTLAGFALGAMIRGSNTLVPGHYHASIGGVTSAYMAMTYLLLESYGWGLEGVRRRLLAAWQPVLFAGGQVIFAVGFSLAGASGMLRKVYGPEQHIRTVGEWIGLALMAGGGLVAVTGGLLFLGLVGAVLIPRLGLRLKLPFRALGRAPI